MELDPADDQSPLFVGQFYRIKRRTGDAERVLTRPSGEPLNFNAAFLLFQIYLDAGRVDDALGAADFEAHVIGEARPGSGLVGSDGSALPVFARDEGSRVLEDIGRAAGNDPSRNRSR